MASLGVRIVSSSAIHPSVECTYISFVTVLTGPSAIYFPSSTAVPHSFRAWPTCIWGNATKALQGNGVFSIYFNHTMSAGTYVLQTLFTVQEGIYLGQSGHARVGLNAGSAGNFGRLVSVRVS